MMTDIVRDVVAAVVAWLLIGILGFIGRWVWGNWRGVPLAYPDVRLRVALVASIAVLILGIVISLSWYQETLWSFDVSEQSWIYDPSPQNASSKAKRDATSDVLRAEFDFGQVDPNRLKKGEEPRATFIRGNVNQDWRGYSLLLLDVANDSPEPLEITYSVYVGGCFYESKAFRSIDSGQELQTIGFNLDKLGQQNYKISCNTENSDNPASYRLVERLDLIVGINAAPANWPSIEGAILVDDIRLQRTERELWIALSMSILASGVAFFICLLLTSRRPRDISSRFFRKLFHVLVTISWFVPSLSLPAQAKAQAPNEKALQPYRCHDIIFDFAHDSQGWTAKQYSHRSGSIVDWGAINDNPEWKTGLTLDLDLDRGHSSAEFLVDLYNTPPSCAQGLSRQVPWWEPGSILSVWVWAPSNTRGHAVSSNGLHLFVADNNGKELYGTWQSFQENTWFEVTLPLGGGAPVCGSQEPGFRFDRIEQIGLNISLNDDEGFYPIKDRILISPIRLKRPKLELPDSYHLYAFDTSIADSVRQWKNLTDEEWKAGAFTDVESSNGTLVAQADFHQTNNVDPEADPGRKGVLGLNFAPALNLSHLDDAQEVISLDIQFDPPPNLQKVNCPFSLKFLAYDGVRKISFESSDLNVGSGEWTRVTYKLSNLFELTETKEITGNPFDLAQIDQMRVQLWANDKVKYQGTISIDNIALGGTVLKQDVARLKPVKTSGNHFSLDGQRFRFIGANAEYLPYVPDSVVIDVLDRAEKMGIRVIRTWGFGEGCQDYSLPSCEESSPYFQIRPGVYNDLAFEHFDRIIYEAQKRKIRLIVALANNWHEHGGIPRYVCWDEQGNEDADCEVRVMEDARHDTFYTDTDIKKLYKQYVTHFVTRVNTITGKVYAEDPTIMAWELINEPRARSYPSGEKLHDWIFEMSGHLRSLAPDQLIGTGEEGWYIMPRSQADAVRNWQEFDKNYWHYGVNWTDKQCIESWGSNGADFLSDHSSQDREVQWQVQVGRRMLPPPEKIERVAVPNIDFTGIHLYVAPGETSLAEAPYCYYYGLKSLCKPSFDTTEPNDIRYEVHQAREWIRQHVETAHIDLSKPFILEEFNFPFLATGIPPREPNSAAMEFRVNPEERARLFNQYLSMAYDLDVDGVLFWNLGYEGFLTQPWSEIDALKNWQPKFEPEETNSEGTGAPLHYDPSQNPRNASMKLTDLDIDWLRADGSRATVNVYNDGDAKQLSFQAWFSDGRIRPSKVFTLKPGENVFSLDELFKRVTEPQSRIECPEPQKDSPSLHQIKVTIRDFTAPGTAYFEFHSTFNNKYVIYPGDPVEEVIRAAAIRWQQDMRPPEPSVSIDKTLMCSPGTHAQLSNGDLSFEFSFTGSLEHLSGYYYHYYIDGPASHDRHDFVYMGRKRSGELSITVTEPGKYRVSIAPEGIGFDSPGADSCYFEITN